MAFEILPDDRDRDDDLAWRAFSYALGDLDAETALAFEQRLDRDQSAREALAEAVLMAAALARAARPIRRRKVWASATALAMAAAAALAMVAVPVLTGSPRRIEPAATPHPATTDAVALAWSGLRHENETENETMGNGNSLDAAGAETDALIDALAEPASEPPSWLVEAAALASTDGSNGQGS